MSDVHALQTAPYAEHTGLGVTLYILHTDRLNSITCCISDERFLQSMHVNPANLCR